eukprot:TRINITY_DN32148_c0_g1_i1.p1 TRINITY_DN32148_c0_g1~~TRINITY_DN32148_c0_g1_i1.p1  ORF type:complete len:606 (-),score=69.65 TRINITY_DN32148_c0_g1_i1:463-2280(-)
MTVEDAQHNRECAPEEELQHQELESDNESTQSCESFEEEEQDEDEALYEEEGQQADNSQGVFQGPLSSCRGESWAVDWMKGIQNMGLTFSIPGMPAKQVVSLSYSQAQRLLKTISAPLASLKVGRMTRKPEGNLATIVADGHRGLLQLSMGLTGDLQLVYKELQEVPIDRRSIDMDNVEYRGGQMIVAEQLAHMYGANVSDTKVTMRYLQDDQSARSFSLQIALEQPFGGNSQMRQCGSSSSRITLSHLTRNGNQPPFETFYFWIAESNLQEGKQELERIIKILKKPPTLAQQSGLPERKLRELQAGFENACSSSQRSPEQESVMSAATFCRTDLDTLEQLGALNSGYFTNQNDENNIWCNAAASVSGLLTNDAIGRSCKVSVTTYVSYCFAFSGEQRRKKKSASTCSRVVRRRSGLIVQDLVRKIGSRRLQSMVAETFVNFRSSLINSGKRTRVSFNLVSGKTDSDRRVLQRQLISEALQIVRLSKGQFNRANFQRAMTQLRQSNFQEEKVRLLLQACAPQVDYACVCGSKQSSRPVDLNVLDIQQQQSRVGYYYEQSQSKQADGLIPNVASSCQDRSVRKVVKVEELDSFVEERVKRLEGWAD